MLSFNKCSADNTTLCLYTFSALDITIRCVNYVTVTPPELQKTFSKLEVVIRCQKEAFVHAKKGLWEEFVTLVSLYSGNSSQLMQTAAEVIVK